MLKKLRIRTRLVLGFTIPIILTAIIVILSLSALEKVHELNNTMYNNSFKGLLAELDTKANVIAVHRAMKDVELSQNSEQLEAAVKSANEYDAKILKSFETIQKLNRIDKVIVDEALKSYNDWTPIREETIRLMREGDAVKAGENTRIKGISQIDLINKNMDKLLGATYNEAVSLNNEITETNKSARLFIFTVLIIIFFLSIVITLFITMSITKPLAMLNSMMGQVADGDLTVDYKNKLKGKDEITNLAKSFMAMLNNLKTLVVQATENAATVATSSQQLMAGSQTATAASEEIALSMQQVATGAENQNGSLNDIKDTLYELAKGAEQTANSMQDISNEVSNVNKLSSNGKNDLDLIIKQMNVINETSQESVIKVKSLEEKSKAIQGIVDMITNISGQTNLLALNAAIEAARAGEQGKGFAVVADEIRKLAEQSANSTRDISTIVKEIQNEILYVINSIEKEEKNIEEGLMKVNTANESFDRILKGISEIIYRVQDVAAVSQQMSAGTDQVVNSIKSISDISGENAAISEEVNASIEEQTSTMEEVSASVTSLTELSASLLGTVSKFKVK